MRDMVFAARFTDNQMVQGQAIMRAALVTATARNFAFWKWTHELVLLKSFLVGGSE